MLDGPTNHSIFKVDWVESSHHSTLTELKQRHSIQNIQVGYNQQTSEQAITGQYGTKLILNMTGSICALKTMCPKHSDSQFHKKKRRISFKKFI